MLNKLNHLRIDIIADALKFTSYIILLGYLWLLVVLLTGTIAQPVLGILSAVGTLKLVKDIHNWLNKE